MTDCFWINLLNQWFELKYILFKGIDLDLSFEGKSVILRVKILDYASAFLMLL